MLIGPFRNPSWFGLSILFGIQREGNLSSLAPDGACFGLDGLISDGSSAYLGRTKGF